VTISIFTEKWSLFRTRGQHVIIFWSRYCFVFCGSLIVFCTFLYLHLCVFFFFVSISFAFVFVFIILTSTFRRNCFTFCALRKVTVFCYRVVNGMEKYGLLPICDIINIYNTKLIFFSYFLPHRSKCTVSLSAQRKLVSA